MKILKLSDERVAELTSRKVKVDTTEYREGLSTIGVGEWGELSLEGDETFRTVKRRLNLAAKELGSTIKYKPVPGDNNKLNFQRLGPDTPVQRRRRRNVA